MRLLDTQYLTPHLEKFGAREIPRSEYMKRLEESLTVTSTFTKEDL
jgi:leucyl/phenylalanyl-tRNA--protein transferase